MLKGRTANVVRILFAIGGGAIINVAVAWGCWLWAPSQSLRNAWLGQSTQGFGWRSTKNYIDGFDGDSLEQAFMVQVVDECGWPSFAFNGSIQIEVPSTRITDREMLPFAPVWPGFAINTIFSAALLWQLFAAPFALRRRMRIKRGQCATCGYSLRENISDKCPGVRRGESEPRPSGSGDVRRIITKLLLFLFAIVNV